MAYCAGILKCAGNPRSAPHQEPADYNYNEGKYALGNEHSW
ncbi:hypothetical protein [Arenibacter latericius]|nr:hypothetical protein [Arenibacter latericius]